jgi:signal transduction histidine kinase
MGIRVEELLAPHLWKAFADRGELERALVNLAVSSRDAMRGAGTLTLETRRTGNVREALSATGALTPDSARRRIPGGFCRRVA